MNSTVLRFLSSLTYGLAAVFGLLTFVLLVSDPPMGMQSHQNGISKIITFSSAFGPAFVTLLTAAVIGGAATALEELKRIRVATEASLVSTEEYVLEEV